MARTMTPAPGTVLTVSPAHRAASEARLRADRLTDALPVLGTDWDGCPIADPARPVACENRA